MWRFGADEAVIVPALYPTLGGTELHVLAISPGGGVVAEWIEFLSAGAVSEGGSWTELVHELPFLGGFVHGELGPGSSPFPGAAIAPHEQGSTPIIAVVDRYSSRTITFRFCVGPSCSPAAGFTELSRTDHAPRVVLTGPTILPYLHTVVGTRDGVAFAGPNPNPPSPITGLNKVYTTPTLTADGRIVVVNVHAEAIGIQGNAVASRVQLGGGTLARPAASRTHVFIATSEAFYTLNADASSTLFRFPWVGGGIWSPVVGPQGHVYAMASNILFIFPAPWGPRGPHFRDVEVEGRAVGGG